MKSDPALYCLQLASAFVTFLYDFRFTGPTYSAILATDDPTIGAAALYGIAFLKIS